MKNSFYKFIIVFLIILIIFILFNKSDNTKINLSKDLASSININLKKDLDDLKDMNNIKIDNYNIVLTTTINRLKPSWFNYIVINKGLDSNIKEGYGVIDKNGLIGVITKVFKNKSIVTLLTNKKVSAKVIIDNKEYYGEINNYNLKTNEFFMSDVIGDFKINNDKVITSSYNEYIPSGIIIGTVSDIKKDKFNLTNELIIKPSSNFNDIKYVGVIIPD